MQTLNVTDYSILNPRLAKVIVSYTGTYDAETFRSQLTAKFKGLASPVAASFKKLQAGVAVGFVRANREIVIPTNKELKASYRVVAKNVLMSESDKNLWDVRSGSAGTYLVRRGEEDLASLVQAAVHRRNDVPGVKAVCIAKAAQSELVAFVDAGGSIDHGFATATSNDRVRVLSVATGMQVEVPYTQVVSIHPVEVDADVRREVKASLTPAEKQNANAYWRQLYQYAPDYMQKVIQQVNQGTVA